MRVVCLMVLIAHVWCEEAKEVLDAIQKYREKIGLKKLSVSKALTATARDRAEAIIGSDNLFNNTSDIWTLATKNKYVPLSLGENIGKSINKEKNGMDIFEGWINSPTHVENLVDKDDYTHIGAYKLVAEKSTYVSAVFGRESKQTKKKQNSKKDTNRDGSRDRSKKDTSRDSNKKTEERDSSTPTVNSTRHISKNTANKKNNIDGSIRDGSIRDGKPNTQKYTNDTSTYTQNSTSNPVLYNTSTTPIPLQPIPSTPSSTSSSTPSIAPSPASTFLLALPESLQHSNSVIKLVIVKEQDSAK